MSREAELRRCQKSSSSLIISGVGEVDRCVFLFMPTFFSRVFEGVQFVLRWVWWRGGVCVGSIFYRMITGVLGGVFWAIGPFLSCSGCCQAGSFDTGATLNFLSRLCLCDMSCFRVAYGGADNEFNHLLRQLVFVPVPVLFFRGAKRQTRTTFAFVQSF